MDLLSEIHCSKISTSLTKLLYCIDDQEVVSIHDLESGRDGNAASITKREMASIALSGHLEAWQLRWIAFRFLPLLCFTTVFTLFEGLRPAGSASARSNGIKYSGMKNRMLWKPHATIQ